MSTHTLTTEDRESTRVRGISLLDSQWDWLYEQAEERDGGNVSRVVRRIIEEYRTRTDGNGMERVS